MATTKDKKFKGWQFGACLACIIVTWPRLVALGGSEFSGGTVTGLLLKISDVGSWLFLAALAVAFVLPRAAALACVAGCVLCAPLQFYFLAPGLFRRIFGGEWKTPLPEAYPWDFWAIVATVTLALAASICVTGTCSSGQQPLGAGNSDSPVGD